MSSIGVSIRMNPNGTAAQIVFPHDDNSLKANPPPKGTIPIDIPFQELKAFDRLYHPDEKPVLAILQPKLSDLGQKQTADIVGQRIAVIDAEVQFNADLEALALVDPLDAQATADAQTKAISSKQELDAATAALDTMQAAIVVVDDPVMDLGP
jgi:hypothetical protein